MEVLRQAVEELYERFGINETTVAASQILDRYILEAQIKGADR